MQTRNLTPALLATALGLALTSQAAIYGPYTMDKDTLHLWHMDTSAPVVDEAPGGINLVGLLNGATLTDPSFAGFGTALNTRDGGQDNIAERNALLTASSATPTPGNVTLTVANTSSGAFTFEAIVWIGFDPAKHMGTTAQGGSGRNTALNIISAESTANGNRIFQFRLLPAGASPATIDGPLLTFENVRMVSGAQTLYAAIPTTGPDAIVSNNWYHVAVTYNGAPNTEGNLKFYWTLLDPSRTEAAQIPITSGVTMLSGLNPMATITSPFMVGNDGRNRTSNFLGLVDEVRISRIARPAVGMMFGQLTPGIVADPVDETVAPGQPASFTVTATGLPPLAYQWRHGGQVIEGATEASLAIGSVQVADAGNYDVVVTNAAGSVTSAAAVLTVRNPLTLTWVGFGEWDRVNINWDSDNDTAADAIYSEGDHVLFNGQGNAFVNLANRMHPSSVTVNSPIDYYLTTLTGGGLDRNARLVKAGMGNLYLETLNAYSGSTVIEEGTLQVGTSVAPGSIGTGPVTNNGSLVVFNGQVPTTSFAGSGEISVNLGSSLTFNTNWSSGPIMMNGGGTIFFNGAESKGKHTSITMNTAGNPGPTLNLGGVVFDAGLSLSMQGTTATPDTRCTIQVSGGTNAFTGPITLGGDGTIQVFANAAGTMTLPTLNSPDFFGKLILRGSGTNNFVEGPITVGKQVSIADAATWTLKAANSWPYGEAAQGATMRMGAAAALPPTSGFNIFGGILDLAGIDQQVAYVTSTNTSSPYAHNYTGMIGNSSSTADAVFTVNSTLTDNFLSAAIVDSVHGGTRKTGLRLTGGGTLTLANTTNSYTGDTIISSGTLALSNAAAIPQSTNIVVSAGATLSATLRTDATLHLTAAQTLKGSGAFNVLGTLNSQGTIELKVNKAGATFTTDRVQGLTSIVYGGTLKVTTSGDPLVAGNSFKLFDAGSYSGAFAVITPSPGPGLSWDTSNLAVNGTLAVKTGPDSTPTGIQVSFPQGNQLQLEWPTSHTGWILQAQTNSLSVGLNSNWANVPESTTTNRVFVTTDPTQGTVFYRLILP